MCSFQRSLVCNCVRGHPLAFDNFFFGMFSSPADPNADTADEVLRYSPSNKDSNSEVQSLNSFQSDSCDDNGKI